MGLVLMLQIIQIFKAVFLIEIWDQFYGIDVDNRAATSIFSLEKPFDEKLKKRKNSSIIADRWALK